MIVSIKLSVTDRESPVRQDRGIKFNYCRFGSAITCRALTFFGLFTFEWISKKRIAHPEPEPDIVDVE